VKVTVKLAEENDVVTAHRLMLEAFEEYQHIEVPSSALNESLSSVYEKYLNGTEKILLCLIDEKPQGTMRFKVGEDALYFMRVSVSPTARGNRLATTMLNWLEEYALQLNLSKLKCRVRMSLPKNILLYESLGYFITKKETVINPNGYEVKTVVMEKAL